MSPVLMGEVGPEGLYLPLTPRLPDPLKSKSNHCMRKCRSVNVSGRAHARVKRTGVFVELTTWDGDAEHTRVDVGGCGPVW
jgi:hypothetical protein